MTITKDKQKANERVVGIFPLEFKDAGRTVEGEIPDTIHIIPIGQWDHAAYGKIVITPSDIKEFAANFQMSLRKGVFITAGHEGFVEQPAVGWFTEVEARDDGLWGKVEWNKLGKETLSDKQFKFFSPEFYTVYEDPQSHQLFKNVLTGGALTKSPYFKELEAVVFSDKAVFNQNDKNQDMTIEEILAKAKDTLTDEEKTFLKEKAGDLTEEQKADYADIIGEGGEGDKGEGEGAGAGEGAGTEGAGTEGGDKQTASEKVLISASELQALRAKADQGAQAFKELEASKINSAIDKMMFSETNKLGHFLPKSKDAIKTFMEGLSQAQRDAFSTIIAQLPKANVFDEKGDDGAETDRQKSIDAKVDAKMKANDKMTYSEALKEVMSENPELAKAHLEEEGEEL